MDELENLKIGGGDENLAVSSSLVANNEKNAKNVIRKSIDFDQIIGYMEDILIDDNFSRLQEAYLENYWSEFENCEENKHSYMEIFNKYTNEIETFIANFIQVRVPDFSMEAFIKQLVQRKDRLDGEVFEILYTITDFNAFKEMFLDYRKVKEDALDFTDAICITPYGKR